MIVVADTSPLNYLVLIGHVEVLHGLYGRILVPGTVLRELSAPGTPGLVREWARQPPAWLEVHEVEVAEDAGLETVDAGEAEAILLAERHRPDVRLVLDDRTARRSAQRRGIATIGTLGVLVDAAEVGLVDLTAALDRLGGTTFRVSPDLVAQLLQRDRSRGRTPRT